jgi:hypothetical protein
MAVVRAWLNERRTIPALEVAASCVAQAGCRSDLDILKCVAGEVGGDADAIRADAAFAVFSRTLS